MAPRGRKRMRRKGAEDKQGGGLVSLLNAAIAISPARASDFEMAKTNMEDTKRKSTRKRRAKGKSTANEDSNLARPLDAEGVAAHFEIGRTLFDENAKNGKGEGHGVCANPRCQKFGLVEYIAPFYGLCETCHAKFRPSVQSVFNKTEDSVDNATTHTGNNHSSSQSQQSYELKETNLTIEDTPNTNEESEVNFRETKRAESGDEVDLAKKSRTEANIRIYGVCNNLNCMSTGNNSANYKGPDGDRTCCRSCAARWRLGALTNYIRR